MTQSQGSLRDKGSFRFDLSYRFMDERRVVGSGGGDGLGTRIDFEQGAIFTGHHQDKGMQHRQLQVEAAYGITRRLTVFGTLPILNEREHAQYEMVVPGASFAEHTHAAAPAGAVVSSIVGSHGAQGFGDAQLGALFAIRARADTPVIARLAVELPTGDYDRVDDQGTIERPDVQPGSGSTDWIFGLSHARPWGGVIFFSAASFTLSGRARSSTASGTSWTCRRGFPGRRENASRSPASSLCASGATTSSAGWRSRTPGRRSSASSPACA